MAPVRYLITSVVTGLATGVAFALMLLATDTQGLRSLLVASADVATTAAIFLVGAAMTVAALVVATAIVFIPQDVTERGAGHATPWDHAGPPS